MSEPDWRSWLERRTFGPPDPDIRALIEAKEGAAVAISVCIPALNEAATIGEIVHTISRLEAIGLVDEIIVSDSGSSDETVALAREAGARIVASEPPVPKGGKGGAMWRAARASTGDILCFLDADVLNFGPNYVTRLVAPLLVDAGLVMVKAFYERPITKSDGSIGTGGARVTELTMRPLLQILCPELTGIIQPLAGECSIRRSALVRIPLVSGYGVEAGMLVDIVHAHGIEAVAQVDLGIRVHRNRDEEVLGETAFQVMEGLLMRLDDNGLVKLPGEPPGEYVRFDAAGRPGTSRSGVSLLPPIAGVEP